MTPHDPVNALHRLVDRIGNWPGIRYWRRRAFERRFHAHVGSNLYYGVHPSFEAARATIPANAAAGYDHAAAAQLYKERTRRIYPGDYPVVYWLQRLLGEGVRSVFDVGGHVGIGWYAYRRYVQFPAELTWTVYDVPAVVEEGRRWAEQQSAGAQLAFTTDFAAGSGADLLFASGSLQYLPRRLPALLQELASPPRLVLVNLVPLHPLRTFYTVQSFGTAVSPYRVESFQSFMEGLADLGYETEDLWQNAEKSCVVAFEPELSLDRYHGALFRRRA